MKHMLNSPIEIVAIENYTAYLKTFYKIKKKKEYIYLLGPYIYDQIHLIIRCWNP